MHTGPAAPLGSGLPVSCSGMPACQGWYGHETSATTCSFSCCVTVYTWWSRKNLKTEALQWRMVTIQHLCHWGQSHHWTSWKPPHSVSCLERARSIATLLPQVSDVVLHKAIVIQSSWHLYSAYVKELPDKELTVSSGKLICNACQEALSVRVYWKVTYNQRNIHAVQQLLAKEVEHCSQSVTLSPSRRFPLKGGDKGQARICHLWWYVQRIHWTLWENDWMCHFCHNSFILGPHSLLAAPNLGFAGLNTQDFLLSHQMVESVWS